MIYIIILFSPVFILFNIYDQNLYYIKDIFIKLSILFHSYIIIEHNIQKKKFEDYLKKIKFFIIPLLIITILIHEYQILFLLVHFLLSLGLSQNKKNISQLLKPYMVLIIPFLFVLIFIGDQSQYESLNQILQKFEVSVHPQLGGGFYKAIGGFYKWHFFYFDYFDFLNLLSALFLGLFLFYFVFQFFLEKNIIIISSKYQKNYLIFFIPCLLCFLLALDHGRNISLISTHLLAFFLILKLNSDKLKKLLNQLNKNFLKRYFIYFFIFFYIFI